MQHQTRYTPADQSGRWWWHPRTCGRRMVTLRVDYATADGRGWQGLIRNLSLQGMYIDTVSCQVTPALTPGDRLTVAFVLPSGGSPASCVPSSSMVDAMGVVCSFWRGICKRLRIWRAIGLRRRNSKPSEAGAVMRVAAGRHSRAGYSVRLKT